MAYTQEDLMKGFGAPNQGLDLSKFEDYSKTISPDISKQQYQEFRDTGTFSSPFINQYKDYLRNQKIQGLDNQVFGDNKGIVTPEFIPIPEIPEITGGTTGGTTGTTGTTGGPIDTQNGQSQFASDFDRQRQENLDALKKETEKIKTEGEKAVEETKKQYLLGQQKFNQNKAYIENFDEVNNLYTGVVNDLVKSMGDSGVINENTYQQIANRYNLTLDEVKNAEKILDRAKYTEEGKKKTGQTEAEQSIADMELARDRKIKDMQTSLDRTLQNYNWQVEDIEKQVSRNLVFMEASGAWSGANRSSGFIEGMQNVKKDGETMINRLKTLAEQASQATEEDIARLQEDFTKAHTKAKEDLTEQLKQFTTNTMLALTEAQATYGMGSTKLQDLLKEIGVNIENQYYEQIERYYRIEDNINKKQLENLTYLQQLVDQETAKIDTNYNNYLSNNGAILQNTSLTTIAQDLREGRINTQRANDLKQIMLTSIQSTLGAIAPITTQDLKTIETLLNQGYTPAEIVAEMQSLEKFTPKTSVKDRFMNVGGNLYDTVNETWVNPEQQQNLMKMGEDSIYDPNTKQWITKPGMGTGVSGDLRGLASQFPNQAWAKNNNPAGITWNANFDNPQPGTTAYRLMEAGINFSKGTARPANEGGNYVTFDTIEDGLKAQRIMMEGTYGNSTVSQMLQSWVGTSEGPNYAKQVAGMAGVDLNTKVSDLSEEQLSTLQLAKIQKESPGLYGLLTQPTQQRTGEFTTTEKAIMDTFLKNPTSKQNIEAMQKAGLTNQDVESYKTIEAGLGILGVPLAYERGIKNMVPATLMNSEVELAQLNDTIKAMAKAGYSQEEAALTYMGFDIDNIKEKGNMDFALKTIDVTKALGLGDDRFKQVVGSVNNFLKRGEEGKVIQTIETEAQRELKKLEGDNYISDSQINFSKQALDKLQGFINKNSDKIGPISGRWSNLAKKFKNNPDYQALTTLLQGNLAEVRRAFAGTAVTETELKAIRDFVGLDTKMPIQNLQSALNTNFESMLMNYNSQRQFAGLPEMTRDFVGSDWNKRVNLYKGTPQGSYMDVINQNSGKTNQNSYTISTNSSDEDIFNALNQFYSSKK